MSCCDASFPLDDACSVLSACFAACVLSWWDAVGLPIGSPAMKQLDQHHFCFCQGVINRMYAVMKCKHRHQMPSTWKDSAKLSQMTNQDTNDKRMSLLSNRNKQYDANADGLQATASSNGWTHACGGQVYLSSSWLHGCILFSCLVVAFGSPNVVHQCRLL